LIPKPKIKLAVLALMSVVLGVPSAGATSVLTKPEIVSAPASSTNATDATLVFTSPDAGVSFTCTLDGLTEPCASPWLYSSLVEGSHSFSVQAEDGVSPPSEPAPWTWTVDLTAPSVQGDETAEATSPLGTAVTFSATDNFDPPPDLSCSPSSGSLFDLGPPASVNCTATDAAGNQSSGSFTVTIVDTTRPVLSPHKDVTVEVQDSLSEAVVEYNLPLATDNGDPAPLVGCAPSSGSTFPLGKTRVTCSAVDGSGNQSAPRRFDVVVQHGPTPAVPLLTSNVGALTNNTNVGFSFETSDGASLDCKLDTPSGQGTFASCTSPQTYTQLGDGSYLFTVRATNSIGNISVASFSWVVDTTPPARVRQLRSSFGSGWVRLSWRNPTDVDFRRVSIWRRKVDAPSWRFLATRKERTTFLDDTVPNDTRFVYALRSVDRARNASPRAKIEGRASKILKPAFGSLHDSPPLIDWAFVRDAAFFNLQLWRDGRKILSAWPVRSAHRLPATWRYNGGRYSLRSDRYRVYVWAAFGSKPHTHYGPLLGWTEFRMK
jgi:LysM repeat protein